MVGRILGTMSPFINALPRRCQIGSGSGSVSSSHFCSIKSSLSSWHRPLAPHGTHCSGNVRGYQDLVHDHPKKRFSNIDRRPWFATITTIAAAAAATTISNRFSKGLYYQLLIQPFWRKQRQSITTTKMTTTVQTWETERQFTTLIRNAIMSQWAMKQQR